MKLNGSGNGKTKSRRMLAEQRWNENKARRNREEAALQAFEHRLLHQAIDQYEAVRGQPGIGQQAARLELEALLRKHGLIRRHGLIYRYCPASDSLVRMKAVR